MGACPYPRPVTNTPDPARAVPGLTACSLCAGETLEGVDTAPDGQLGRLRQLEADGVTRLTLVECLDECERGDVVVARPSSCRRDAGAAPVWFEQLAGDAQTTALASWLRAGGPGSAPLPSDLEPRVIRRGPVAD
jgi:hypothetical protein